MRYANLKIAAAVAAAMAGHQAAIAAAPTPNQCAIGSGQPLVAPSTLYIAGSAAAQSVLA